MSRTQQHKIPQAIKSLVTRITNTVLRINERGHYHAFIDLTGHVNTLYIHIHPATDNYQYHPSPVFTRDFCYSQAHRKEPDLEETNEKTLARLNQALNDLKPYLSAPKAQGVAA